jgi:hypothetical protein
MSRGLLRRWSERPAGAAVSEGSRPGRTALPERPASEPPVLSWGFVRGVL